MNNTSNKIYCMTCDKEVEAIIVSGRTVYPHRQDLWARLFWQCPHCGNYVGTHKKTGIPLGCIPNKYMRFLRKQIHGIIDPIWKENHTSRRAVYSVMSALMGKDYHTANLSSIDEANKALTVAKLVAESFQPKDVLIK